MAQVYAIFPLLLVPQMKNAHQLCQMMAFLAQVISRGF
jgi:hypothetical protein